MIRTNSARHLLATGTVALAAVVLAGGSHAVTAHAAAAATTLTCDQFGSCYDDGLSTSFNDPNSSWMNFWDSNSGTSGYYDTNSGDLWSSAGTTDPGPGLGGGYDPSWSSYSGLYDPGSSTSTVGGDSTGSSDWSTYSGLYDPGTE